MLFSYLIRDLIGDDDVFEVLVPIGPGPPTGLVLVLVVLIPLGLPDGGVVPVLEYVLLPLAPGPLSGVFPGNLGIDPPPTGPVGLKIPCQGLPGRCGVLLVCLLTSGDANVLVSVRPPPHV
jgi:hypothetical protein